MHSILKCQGIDVVGLNSDKHLPLVYLCVHVSYCVEMYTFSV